MNPVLATAGMLIGILMVVCGILVALLTGLDPIYGTAGIAIAAGGGTAAWYCQRNAPAPSETSGGIHERSVQKPAENSSRSKFDKKI